MEELIKENVDLVFYLSREYKAYDTEENLQQIALASLIKGVHVFEGNNEKLRAFLKEQVEGEILNYISNLAIDEINIPFSKKWKEKAKNLLKELSSAEKKVLLYRFMGEKTKEEVAMETGLSVETIEEIENKCFEKIKN